MIFTALLGTIVLLASIILTFFILRHFFYTMVALAFPPVSRPIENPATNFTVLIPAHNEEKGVAETIESVKAQVYPPHLFKIVVLADNCTDKTAQIARDLGVTVMERDDPHLRGKGYALDWFISSKKWRDDEALVCIDADSIAKPMYLKLLDSAIQHGGKAVQGYNGAKDPRGSRLAALSLVTNTMKNAGTYAGRASLGLPVPLMNGWCIKGSVLSDFGWQSFSVTEDYEQTLKLGIHGVYPRFVPEAVVLSDKARTFSAATAQRMRWSGGEGALAKTLAWPALRTALQTRSHGLLELTMDVFLPGYATTAAGLVVCLVIAALLNADPAAWTAFVGIALLTVTSLVGYLKAGPDYELTSALALAPVFIFWKSVVAVFGYLRPPKEWKRADRDAK